MPHGFGGRMWACYQQVVKETVSDLLRAHKMASVVKGAYHPPDDCVEEIVQQVLQETVLQLGAVMPVCSAS